MKEIMDPEGPRPDTKSVGATLEAPIKRGSFWERLSGRGKSADVVRQPEEESLEDLLTPNVPAREKGSDTPVSAQDQSKIDQIKDYLEEKADKKDETSPEESKDKPKNSNLVQALTPEQQQEMDQALRTRVYKGLEVVGKKNVGGVEGLVVKVPAKDGQPGGEVFIRPGLERSLNALPGPTALVPEMPAPAGTLFTHEQIEDLLSQAEASPWADPSEIVQRELIRLSQELTLTREQRRDILDEIRGRIRLHQGIVAFTKAYNAYYNKNRPISDKEYKESMQLFQLMSGGYKDSGPNSSREKLLRIPGVRDAVGLIQYKDYFKGHLGDNPRARAYKQGLRDELEALGHGVYERETAIDLAEKYLIITGQAKKYGMRELESVPGYAAEPQLEELGNISKGFFGFFKTFIPK